MEDSEQQQWRERWRQLNPTHARRLVYGTYRAAGATHITVVRTEAIEDRARLKGTR